MEGRVDRSRQAGTARRHGRIRRAGDHPVAVRVPARQGVAENTIVVLCEGEEASGLALKELHRSDDGGVTWRKPSYAPYEGLTMHLDLASDGTGWMWGDRSPLLATTDGGVTWTSLAVADPDLRLTIDADAWGLGAGVVLIRDQEHATLLLVNGDGAASEMSTWTLDCCGG